MCVSVVFVSLFGDSPPDQGETCTTVHTAMYLGYYTCRAFCTSRTNRGNTGGDKHLVFVLIFFCFGEEISVFTPLGDFLRCSRANVECVPLL